MQRNWQVFFLASALAAGGYFWAGQAQAAITTPVSVVPFNVYDFSLSGGSEVALARDGESGFLSIPATFSVQVSPNHAATGEIKVYLPEGPVENDAVLNFDITFTAHLDLVITRSSELEFFPGVANSDDGWSLAITGDAPVTFTGSGSFLADTTLPNFGLYFDDIALAGEYHWLEQLVVDINGDGTLDQISATLNTVVLDEVADEPAESTTEEGTTEEGTTEEGTEKKENAAKKATKKGVKIKIPKGLPLVGYPYATGSLTGSVNPPFSADLEGGLVMAAPALEAPEPSSVIIWSLGAISLGWFRRKRMNAPLGVSAKAKTV